MDTMNLSKNITFDNLSFEDVRKLYEQMERENVLSKYNFPTKPSSDGYYHVWVTDPTNKNGRKQLKAKHIDKLKTKVYEYEKGINGNVRKTFQDVFNILMEEKLKYIKDPEKLLSATNTISHMKFSYGKFFSGTKFERMYINEITKSDIENITFQTLDKFEVKRKAFFEIRGIMKQVFRLAYEQYWIEDDVYTRVNFNKYNDMLSKSTPISKRVHTDEEIDRMLEYINKCHEKKPDYIPAYALELQILAGLRRGEIPPIEWSDVTEDCINITKEQINVTTKHGRITRIVNHTKTYVNRSFPMTTELKSFFVKLKEVHDTYYPNSKYCFPDTKTETGAIMNSIVYPFYSRMCKKLGIEICSEIIKGPHSFRRNGITKVSNTPGGNMLIASMLYGNSPKSIASHYYSGINMESAKELLESNQKVTKI